VAGEKSTVVTDTLEARTPLYETHVRLGAKMSPFGGFLMPISYAGIIVEHDAVRNSVGMFDLSHMGQFIVTGSGADAWLDGLTTNHVATMRPRQARYNIFTNERGGALDDTIVYRFPDKWLVVVNASNTQKMWSWLTAVRTPPAGVIIDDRTKRSALIALQGPLSVQMLAPLAGIDLAAIKYYHAAEGTVAGVAAEIARTGYTGEDGFELFIAARDAEALWDRLTEEGNRFGLTPAGLGARDVLRLEAGMPLYGHELDEAITPLQAGLRWAVKLDKPFVGRDALHAQESRGDYARIAGFIMDGKAPARSGYSVYFEGAAVGEVRSGSPSPSLGGKNIGTALVPRSASAPGTKIEVEIRGTRHAATVTDLPFYRRKR
jgi:aminomethyltransferase